MKSSDAVLLRHVASRPCQNEQEFRRFVKKGERQNACAYCGKPISIMTPDDLHGARCVQLRMAAGIPTDGGPLCCPTCASQISAGKILFCTVCGKSITHGRFCSVKCDIAYCED